MYQAHWGLQDMPFASGLDCGRFFRSPTHDEALARLHFLVDEHRRLGLLLGQSGCGKSLLLEVLAREVSLSSTIVGKLNLLGLSEQAFLWQLSESLGLFPCRNESLHSLWRSITDRLHEHRCQQVQTLLLLDDADETPPEVLEQIVRLSQQQAGDSSLTIILTAAGHRLARLGQRLLSLIELRTDIHAWEEEDTIQFVTDALKRAGREEPIFDDSALRRIHELSGGIPRRASQLADLALLVGAAQEQTSIDEATVETVAQELGVSSEQFLAR